MASTSSFPRDRPLMPGSFSPDDLIDLYHNPWDALEELQDKWRSKNLVLDKIPEIDLGDVDWHKYDPPRTLREAPNVTSQVLLDIVASSIENIKARVAEEDRQKREREEEQKRVEEEAAREAQKGKEPYLPIIIVQEVPKTPPTITFDDIEKSIYRPEADDARSILTAKIEKRRKFALRRLFQRSSDRGESSATGSARETLRKKIEAKLGEAGESSSKDSFEALRQKLSSKPEPGLMVECVSCLDDFPVHDTVKVPCHNYCHDCFRLLINTAMENDQQWPPKCCLNPIPFKDILRSIPANMKTAFQEKVSESEVPASERIYCSDTSCGIWVRPDRIVPSRSQARCEQGHWTCIMCRGPAHDGQDCPLDRDMNLTNQLAEEEGWKRCYNCQALVEHREACQHMTCRCGTQFCYVCGLRWRSCSCTMQQLYDLKQGAQTRRNARVQREQQEAEELRALLAEIEEFEREEERKAELLRQEQLRIEEERRQRELEERVRQESIRRREVELKYQELRASMDLLHELQQILLEAAHETEATDLAAALKAKKERLAQKQEADRASMISRILSRISTKELEFNKDYATRVAQEKKIEEDYHQQLVAFWAGKKGGDAEVDKGMQPLRQRMDQNHRAWQKWKNGELEVYRTMLEDERTIREELMYSAKQRLEDACVAESVERERRSAAEVKWLDVLILERERLMGASEVEEMEGDADSIFAPEASDDEGAV